MKRVRRENEGGPGRRAHLPVWLDWTKSTDAYIDLSLCVQTLTLTVCQSTTV